MSRSEAREILATLSAQPAFAACSAADLEDLATHSARTSVPKNWPLIHQGTPSDACYILLSGEAEIVSKGVPVATITTGAVVGEAGLSGHRLRNASVNSLTALDLLRIDGSEFDALLDRRPALKAVVLAPYR